jgi:hypothetical protein
MSQQKGRKSQAESFFLFFSGAFFFVNRRKMTSPPVHLLAHSSSSSLSWNWNGLDDRALPFLRGSNCFSLLFDERFSPNIFKVYSLPGHFAATLTPSTNTTCSYSSLSPSISNPTSSFTARPTTLCVFDNVSPSSSSSSSTLPPKEWINQVLTITTTSSSSSSSHSTSSTSSILNGNLVTFHPNTIATVLFDVEQASTRNTTLNQSSEQEPTFSHPPPSLSSTLRLLVVESTGDVYSWQWIGQSSLDVSSFPSASNSTDYSWKFIGKTLLPGISRGGSSVGGGSVGGSVGGKSFGLRVEDALWVSSLSKLFYLCRIDANELKLFACDFSFASPGQTEPSPSSSSPSSSPIRISTTRQIIINIKSNLLEGDEPKLLAGKGGFWILTKRNISFWSFRSQIAQSISTTPSESSSDDSVALVASSDASSSSSSPSSSNDNNTIRSELLQITMHAITRELVLLEKSGRVLACSSGAGGGGVQLRFLFTIPPIVFDSRNFVSFFVHRHFGGLITEGDGASCFFFDLQTGLPVGEARIPQTYSILSRRKASSSGNASAIKNNHYRLCEYGLLQSAFDAIVWSVAGGGIWKLAIPTVRLQAITIAASASSSSSALALVTPTSSLSSSFATSPPANAGSAALRASKICSDWGLDYWQTKYALDALQQAQKQGDETLKRMAYQKGIPFLQNPALAIALLSSGDTPLYNDFVIGELEKFLRSYYCAPLEATSSEPSSSSSSLSFRSSPKDLRRSNSSNFSKLFPSGSFSSPGFSSSPFLAEEGKRIAIRIAYHLHTPLNKQMAPLLGKFLQQTLKHASKERIVLSSQAVSLLRRRRRANSALVLDSKEEAPDSVLNMERSQLESLARIDPTKTLHRLEASLNLTNFEEWFDHVSSAASSATSSSSSSSSSSSTSSPPSSVVSDSSASPTSGQIQQIQLLPSRTSTPTKSRLKSPLPPTPSPFYFFFTQNSSLPPPSLSEDIWKVQDQEITSLLMRGSRSPKHPYFEVLCRLYYQLKPRLLVPFVHLVSATSHRSTENGETLSASSSSGSSFSSSSSNYQRGPGARKPFAFYERALMALPLLVPHEIATLNDNQIDARAQLLIANQQVNEALELLLCTERYERALSTVARAFSQKTSSIASPPSSSSSAPSNISSNPSTSSSQEELEQFEMFYVVFASSLRRKDAQMCQKLFSFIPPKFQALDFLKTVEFHLDLDNQEQVDSSSFSSSSSSSKLTTLASATKTNGVSVSGKLGVQKGKKVKANSRDESSETEKKPIVPILAQNGELMVDLFRPLLLTMFENESL